MISLYRIDFAEVPICRSYFANARTPRQRSPFSYNLRDRRILSLFTSIAIVTTAFSVISPSSITEAMLYCALWFWLVLYFLQMRVRRKITNKERRYGGSFSRHMVKVGLKTLTCKRNRNVLCCHFYLVWCTSFLLFLFNYPSNSSRLFIWRLSIFFVLDSRDRVWSELRKGCGI
jgi:hypothetical protein